MLSRKEVAEGISLGIGGKARELSEGLITSERVALNATCALEFTLDTGSIKKAFGVRSDLARLDL